MTPRAPTHRNDAELLLAVIEATATWEGDTQTDAVVKPIRELLWAVWEKPRLGQSVRGKYPVDALWSRAARDAYESDPRCRLVLEHVIPVNLVVRHLLRRPPRTLAALVRILNRQLEHTVITPAENRRLTAAKDGWKLAADSLDGWERYRVAGIKVKGFAPLFE
jgi:hypothetical protein